MSKICLVISSLQCGGAERQISVLANHWANAGEDVYLIVLNSSPESTFFSIDERVRTVYARQEAKSDSVLRGISHNYQRIACLRKHFRAFRPDIVISFLLQTNVLSIIAARLEGIPVMVADGSDPITSPQPRIWKKLRDILYPRSQSVVVQTDTAKHRYIPSIQRKIAVIPNPLSMPPSVRFHKGGEFKRLVALGRLTPAKGFQDLISAFEQVHAVHADWKLTIHGEGPERVRLQAQIDRLGLREVVELPGLCHDAWGALAQGDIFVLSSHWEGFPNALIEAMAVGLPVISTDCKSGPAEIVVSGSNGVLVQTEAPGAIAEQVDLLIRSPERREQMGREASKVVERLGTDAISKEWQSLISAILAPAPSR